MRNIFLEKSYAKCEGETSFRSFSKRSKLNISNSLKLWINSHFHVRYSKLLKKIWGLTNLVVLDFAMVPNGSTVDNIAMVI